jgi:trans-aconitate methyltransferase
VSVAAHLGIRIDEYDARIRTFIPWYDEMLGAAAEAMAVHVHVRAPVLVDLGIGSGALSARCAASSRRIRIVGIDADEAMLAFARKRLGRRLAAVASDFERVAVPRCDAIVASLALHHVRTPKAKAALYRRCFGALARHGAIVIADCCLASSPAQQQRDRGVWREHLERSYTAREASSYLRAWAREDVYLPLADEIDLLRRAGFIVDVPWRRGCFAVIAGTKSAVAGIEKQVRQGRQVR